MTVQTLTRQFAEIVGPEYVSEDTGAFTVHGCAPALVVSPVNVEELAQVVAACHSARVPVVPWGGGTRQRWGRPLDAPAFVAVRTGRLDQALLYEPDDLTISVQAGMTLGTLDATLAANGQMLPLDTPLPGRSTIGGILATGADGPRRPGYGTARDLLIGIGVVEAGGRFSKAGGMVVKNVSGFDMMKLYLGSLGSLAIIVSANFKLLPRPRAAAGLLATFDRPEAAFALVEAIHAAQLTPVAVEYLEGWTVTGGEHSRPTVCIWAEGLPAAVERHGRDLEVMAAKAGARGFQVARDEAHSSLWAAIADLARSDEVSADELALRLGCLPADLDQALTDARTLAARHGLALRICARALSGVAYLRLAGPTEGLHAVHAELLQRRPQLTLLAGPPALAAELPAWGASFANLELMRRIKQEFDPEGMLNPGRFVV